MTDFDQISLRLNHLREYLEILKGFRCVSIKEFKDDPVKRGATERYLQLAAEACIDIGEIIIAGENLKIPDESFEIFIILGAAGILPKSFALKFAPIARFRNLLVHEYVKIDFKKVHQYLQKDLGDFYKFQHSIARYLQKKKRRAR